MRFESIDIENYRQYKSLHMDFPKGDVTDLHVIVASNGVGKTNLLNAINWCLYGDEPHLGNEDDALTICNHTALQEAKDAGQKFAEVNVVIHATSDGEIIEYKRSCQVNTATRFKQKPEFTVIVTPDSGDAEIRTGDLAIQTVDQYTPRKIRQYFFFDGEQLHNYFGPNRDTTHVKDSIYEIAQINVVSMAVQHFNTLIEGYQKELSKLHPNLTDILSRIQEKETLRASYNTQIVELKKSVAESTAEISRLSELIAGSDSVVTDQAVYNRNITQLEEDEESLQAAKNNLFKLCREYSVLLYFYNVNLNTYNYIQEKYNSGKLPPDINVEMIRESLNLHKCVICQQPTSKQTEELLQHLLDKFEDTPAVSHKLMEIKNDVERFVKKAKEYTRKKQDLNNTISKLENRIKETEQENEDLIKRIRVSSSVQDIATWMEQRDDHRKLIPVNTEKISSYEAEIRDIDRDLSFLEENRKKSVEDAVKCSEIQDELTFATQARNIVAETECEIVGEVRTQMELETMSIFNELIWRKNTYGRISLDDNYRLKLYHKITDESCLGSCSAAERELLALAFTIALHRVSGHDSLLFIDTPVGRVSDENRENFAKKLITVSEHKQLILAFTPSEFSDEVRKYFTSSCLASFNKLSSENEENTLQEGANNNG